MNIYMVGIGGIGMSALAQYYLARGHTVAGSDRVHSLTVEMLEKKGIAVTIGQDGGDIGNPDLLVYSDAIPENQRERALARERGIREQSLFQAEGEISKGAAKTIVVSGTHGKTTTTGMLTKILADAGRRPTAIIGSIIKDFGTNFVDGDPNLFVVEGCEYKDHLLEFSPSILVVTNVEWDHTDWFKTEADMRSTFEKAKAKAEVVIDASVYKNEPEYELQLIGEFNKDNARAAAAAARAAFPDISDEQIRASLASYQGSWRRFEYKGKTKNGVAVYDDYAHHPTAIRETLKGVREKFPGSPVTVAFHPHLYSRTRDLFSSFVTELAKADRVILAPIYAAREVDDGSVSSGMLADSIAKTNPNVESLRDFDAIQSKLESVTDGIIITMGAGDIYKVAERIV